MDGWMDGWSNIRFPNNAIFIWADSCADVTQNRVVYRNCPWQGYNNTIYKWSAYICIGKWFRSRQFSRPFVPMITHTVHSPCCGGGGRSKNSRSSNELLWTSWERKEKQTLCIVLFSSSSCIVLSYLVAMHALVCQQFWLVCPLSFHSGDPCGHGRVQPPLLR